MADLIEKFNLSPHPEGGYYREIHRSGLTVASGPANARRNALTHIYFLLTQDDISRFHKVIHDEVWNFYQGDPVNLLLYTQGRVTENLLGPDCPALAVPAGTWQAAAPTGEFAFVGCSVAPGFDFADFSFLSDIPQDLEAFMAANEKYKKYL